jgi:hypothetical protein
MQQGKLIESFTSYYHEHHNIIAQFHEWMTGTGILYLKKYAPWIATSLQHMQLFWAAALQVTTGLCTAKWKL